MHIDAATTLPSPATIVVLALALSSHSVVHGNPNHENPQQLLPIHMQENSALFEDAKKRHAELTATLQKMTTLYTNKRIDSASPKDFVTAYRAVGYLRDRARRLQCSGETTGFDLELRVARLDSRRELLWDYFKRTNSFQRVLQKARVSLNRKDKRFKQELEKIKKLMAAGKFAEAWDQAHVTQYETLDEQCLLIDAPTEYEVTRSFMECQAQVELAWKKAAVAAIDARSAASMPNLADLLKRLKSARVEIAASGVATLGGQSVAGPVVVARFHQQWRKVHVAVVRTAALQFARNSLVGQDSMQRYQKTLHDYDQFGANMVSGLADLVAADAQRVEAAGARQLHARYVASLAPLASDLTQERFLEPLRIALAAFGRKSSELRERIEAYRDATSEHLRWKERVAAAETAKASAATKYLGDQFREAALSSGQPNSIFTTRNKETAELRAPAPDYAALIASRLMKQPTRIKSGSKASPQAPTTIGRYAARTYAILYDVEPLVEPHRQRLAADLLIDPEHPPLTLDAATAIQSVSDSRFLHAGGVVAGCHLESVVTRMATLPDAAHPFIQLEVLPNPLAKQAR